MFNWRSAWCAAIAVCAAGAVYAGASHPNIGRDATPSEISAWDIDVRPDFKGLPKGSGSVAKGQEVWESKCASCHGVFGESAEVFNPLVGGTTKADIEAGNVARLKDAAYPGRTTLMKLAYVSTLWDYINRAMPWNTPKSLTTEEVYGVTAYLLNMGGIVPDDFVLSEMNVADVQRRLPNRNGLTQAHAMWPGRELGGLAQPDVQGSSCMSNCSSSLKVGSALPEYARTAHGNLAEQNRLVGPQRGAVTLAKTEAKAEEREVQAAVPSQAAKPAGDSSKAVTALLQKNACTGCHATASKLVGPAFQEVAKKYAGRADATSYLAERIKSGGAGVWGSIPMPPQSLSQEEAGAIAAWLAAGAR